MTGVRIYVLVEGPTEEQFVSRFLADHFQSREIWLMPIRVGRATSAANAGGGMSGYGRPRRDLLRLLGDGRAYVTTMFDLYGLPDDFPGFSTLPVGLRGHRKALHLETALGKDIGHPVRFIPYLQLHEFEALLFSNVQMLDEELKVQHGTSVLPHLEGVLAECGEPEAINDHPSTAPSKRLLALTSGQYSKVVNGFTVAQRIGLVTIRARCPHFDAWISRLESLPSL